WTRGRRSAWLDDGDSGLGAGAAADGADPRGVLAGSGEGGDRAVDLAVGHRDHHAEAQVEGAPHLLLGDAARGDEGEHAGAGPRRAVELDGELALARAEHARRVVDQAAPGDVRGPLPVDARPGEGSEGRHVNAGRSQELVRHTGAAERGRVIVEAEPEDLEEDLA